MERSLDMITTKPASLVPASFLSYASCLLPEPVQRIEVTAPRAGGRLHALPNMNAEAEGVLRSPLTPAEKRVLELVLAGLADKEIASVLERAVPTVKHQVSAILQKYRVPSRARLMAVLRANGAGEASTTFYGRTGS